MPRRHCPQCDYDLEDLQSPRCPECGWVVDRAVRTPGRVGWWLGTAGLVALYGLALFGMAMLAFGSVVHGIIGLVVIIDAPLRIRRWIRRRRAFGLLPRHIQQQWVAGWWLAALVVGVLVLAPLFKR
jgi:hypothetical protein